MTGARRHLWQELSSAEIGRQDPERTVALLPVAAIEQHGPHLPVGVDAMINQGIVEAALARLPADLALLVLPMLPVGKSDEHEDYPGTLSLEAETLARLWIETGSSVAGSGLRKLVVFNSHGGQSAVMDIAARELRRRHGMLVMAYSWPAGGLPAGLFPAEEARFGIHAGAIETAMMLHLRPELVDMSKAADFRPLMADMAADGYRRLSPVGAGRMGWKAQDLHPSGAAGDARNADAARGRALVEHAADALVELLQEMQRFPLARLQATPPAAPG
jgi:creatinine amidohydrolase